MSDDGEIIALDSENWSCILDNNSSLVWEVKSEEKGVQYALNTYTWFDGESGRDNGTFSKNCYWGKNCNTLSFVDDINKAELCGYSNWRLPTRDELNSLFVKTQDGEKEFIKVVTEKYGDGILDPQTGVYNPKVEK